MEPHIVSSLSAKPARPNGWPMIQRSTNLREMRFECDLINAAATEHVAELVAHHARSGDVIGLSGDLGTGKTCFARAFIAARAAQCGAKQEEVPSPTFTLVQTYELAGLTIWHFDLYRLDNAGDAYELGIEDAFADGISLIEWPERIAALLPDDRLDIALDFAEDAGRHPDVRRLSLHGRGNWAGRAEAMARSLKSPPKGEAR